MREQAIAEYHEPLAADEADRETVRAPDRRRGPRGNGALVIVEWRCGSTKGMSGQSSVAGWFKLEEVVLIHAHAAP